MKKLISVIVAITMIACLFTACGASADDGVYKIAIVQQLDHASLDEIRTAVEAQLDAIAAEKGITIEYKDFNGQNDPTVLGQIGAQVVGDGYDAIIPIATLAAQCMVTAADGTDTPIIYAAISDRYRRSDRHCKCHRHLRRTEHPVHPGHDVRRESRHPDRRPAVLQQ